jgi:hypothetical protein
MLHGSILHHGFFCRHACWDVCIVESPKRLIAEYSVYNSVIPRVLRLRSTISCKINMLLKYLKEYHALQGIAKPSPEPLSWQSAYSSSCLSASLMQVGWRDHGLCRMSLDALVRSSHHKIYALLKYLYSPLFFPACRTLSVCFGRKWRVCLPVKQQESWW